MRLRTLFRRKDEEQGLDDELGYHIDREVERRVAAGMTPEDARRVVEREFGNVPLLKDEMRDSWGTRAIDEFLSDVRFSLRGFRRSPSFVLTVVLTIALGLGLNTAVFTLFNGYVLRPLKLVDAGSLYQPQFVDRTGRGRRLTWSEFDDLKNVPVVAARFAFVPVFARSDRLPLQGMAVSGEALEVMGATPLLGRLLRPDDATPPTGQPVAVLSYDAWRAKFGSDTAVIGRPVVLRGVTLTIVGVGQPDFTGVGPVPPDFWIPITLLKPFRGLDLFGSDSAAALNVIVRTRAGVSVSGATAALGSWAARITAWQTDSLRWTRALLTSVAAPLPLDPNTIMIFLPAAIAFALVLLIACANVANVMLARGIARQREVGIRLALGAPRRRVVRQLLTESLLLAAPAAALGLAVSRWTIMGGIQVMMATIPGDFAPYLRFLPLAPDLRVFGFVLALSLLAALAFGLAPAIQATRPSVAHFSRGDGDAGSGAGRLRGALVIAQIGTCALLLIVTGILLRGSGSAQQLPTGVRTHDVVQVTPDESARRLVTERLKAEPFVRSVGASTGSPFNGIYPAFPAHTSGEGSRDARVIAAGVDFADAAFFDVLGITVVHGRAFTDQEARTGATVAIVSEATAAALWGRADPIGKSVEIVVPERRIKTAYGRVHIAAVVGVARNAVSGWIGTGLNRPVIYYPQSAETPGMALLAQVSGDARVAKTSIDRDIGGTAPAGAIFDLHTMDEQLAVQVWPFQIFSWLSSGIGAIALVLTLIGIYGVLSYLVAQRTREIGIRMALGASAAGVVGQVVRQSLRYAVIGTVVGTVLAIGFSQVVGSHIVIIDSFDTWGYVFGMGVVLVASVVAAWAPSRRAARVNPVEALRTE